MSLIAGDSLGPCRTARHALRLPRRLAIAAGLASIVAAVDGAWPGRGVSAQAVGSGDEPVQARGGCFRGEPLPACRSFFVLELQGAKPLRQTTRRIFVTPNGPSYPIPQFGGRVEWNLGIMFNVAPKWAWGAVVTPGLGGDRSPVGLRLRGRRWMSENTSLELEAGLLRDNGEGSSTMGYTAGTRVNFRDRMSFFLRWDGLDVPSEPPAYPVAGGFQQAISIGAGLGSRPALIGTGVLALYVSFMVLLIFSDPNYT